MSYCYACDSANQIKQAKDTSQGLHTSSQQLPTAHTCSHLLTTMRTAVKVGTSRTNMPTFVETAPFLFISRVLATTKVNLSYKQINTIQQALLTINSTASAHS